MSKSANPRPRKKGDDSYNARRRYIRSAQRYLKQAASSVGATASRYRQLARNAYENALRTYQAGKQKFSKAIQEIGKELGMKPTRKDTDDEIRQRAIRKSREFNVPKDEISIEQLREREAERILKSDGIGKRVIAGLIDVWRDSASVIKYDDRVSELRSVIDTSKIYPAIFDYFNVSSYSELLETLESVIGERLYAIDDESANVYETVKLVLQSYVLDNRAVV